MALPFDLPTVSRGYAEVTAAARTAGRRAADGAASALGRVLACEVRLEARALPGPESPAAGAARLGLDLAALPAPAALEVDAALVARLVDRVAGGPGEPAGATVLTPLETSMLELLALAAVEGACGAAPELDRLLAPRLVRRATPVPGALAVELRFSAAGVSGAARLLLPPMALRALRASGPMPPIAIPASLRSGAATLAPEDLAALSPGDVVLLDLPPGERHVALFPGGLAAAGRIEGDSLHVEETSMTEPHAQLPVTLEVELVRFPVMLADLARLEPGAILNLPVDRRGLVTLRAAERAVARGELVDVDGAVGVRVLSIEAAP
jgi:type III secretion protein Q